MNVAFSGAACASPPEVRTSRCAVASVAWGASLWFAFLLADIPDSCAEAAPPSILDLQPLRQVSFLEVSGAAGRRGMATLINLNPRINEWFVLRLDWTGPAATDSYHLENVDAARTKLSLARESGGYGIHLESGGWKVDCPLGSAGETSVLESARRTRLAFAPVCNGRVYVRNPIVGAYTSLERVTNLLRDHVWQGDQLVTLVREEFFQDSFAEQGVMVTNPTVVHDSNAAAPLPARLAEPSAEAAISSAHLGIDVVVDSGTGVALGQWYPIRDSPGIFLSAIKPEAIAADILSGFPKSVARLDPIEASAVDYLVAFDLSQLDLRFALGTDHPRLGWSRRARDEMRDSRLPGPDGIGDSAPLERSGMVSPAVASRTVAAFAGGYKREHGAFRYGALAVRNHGSHYGFMEEGVIFSSLEPGLATLYVRDDGTVGMKTWSADDAELAQRLRYARQNGVALLERTADGGGPVPGALVNQWGAGNWSGSADERLRTLRAGVCLQQSPTRRFLIYGYFSTATPSAMARVFQAYGCEYAMHLDMNALEHTYLALYTRVAGRLIVQHLVDGMRTADRKAANGVAPRFLAFPDNRDFFYLLKRASGP